MFALLTPFFYYFFFFVSFVCLSIYKQDAQQKIIKKKANINWDLELDTQEELKKAKQAEESTANEIV